jgi:TonB family protein
MKNLKLIFVSNALALVLLNGIHAQETRQYDSMGQPVVNTKAEQMPEFIGGEKKLFEYIAANVTYPDSAKEKGIEGRVYVQFIVDKTGDVKNPKILRGIGGGCDEEVLRMVNNMPDWLPGKDDGKPVDVLFTLPVNFNIR